jgi:hypothetical protein
MVPMVTSLTGQFEASMAYRIARGNHGDTNFGQ